MDMATIAGRLGKKLGTLPNVDVSDEVNACCVTADIPVTENGVTRTVPYYILFKNETHNHPTEIEPFGGAATCLGGAIRDPLSGRAYVYQAMRITGAADPQSPTLPGKLPQQRLTRTAADGFSSYGNQIGLATGYVDEIYHPGYMAKRMEIGACVGAVPQGRCIRSTPACGDVILLVGGRTGRDGIGGATGSSKAHNDTSLSTCGAEVQKGNPPEERKLQRLMLHGEASKLIKRCNDFGAGGVAVAIGELARGLHVELSAIPTKYDGLNPTELTISESQERMAVVIAKGDVDTFMRYVALENLEATAVGYVTDDDTVTFAYKGVNAVELKRTLLDSNGASKSARVVVPQTDYDKLDAYIHNSGAADEAAMLRTMSDLNVCGKMGLVSMFDSSIGAGSVVAPFGGRHQRTPLQYTAMHVPVDGGETSAITVMSHGYDPYLSEISPFHGAVYAIVHSVAKQIAAGVTLSQIHLTLQEYFRRCSAPEHWGLPMSALLGAFYAQSHLGIAAIGGKDSMSGSFGDLHVPPTLVSFAVGITEDTRIITNELKGAGHTLVLVECPQGDSCMPDFAALKAIYDKASALMQGGAVLSAHAVGYGGVAAAVATMAFGNGVGVDITYDQPFAPQYGALLLETVGDVDMGTVIGKTTDAGDITINQSTTSIEALYDAWYAPLSRVFDMSSDTVYDKPPRTYAYTTSARLSSQNKHAKPTVVMPVFAGTNNELDALRGFKRAGAEVNTLVFRNLTPADTAESLAELCRCLDQAQILLFNGGFSAGDQPEGSAKFIANVCRNPAVADAIHRLLDRDGLILGVCNGFQALVKVGLLPYGRISPYTSESPTLTYNTIGRFMSRLVRTRVSSNQSPWLYHANVGDIRYVPIAHGEGRFICGEDLLRQLADNGQIATQYVDIDGNVTYDDRYNHNGSIDAIEGITSPDGRIFGKMGHCERIRHGLFKNILDHNDMLDDGIYLSGVTYFN